MMSGPDRILFLISFGLGLLFVLSIAFALVVVVLRVRNRREAARWQALEGAWADRLLDVLAGVAPPEHIWHRVRRRDELRFLVFLLRYARRLKGGELETLGMLARPYLPRLARGMRSRRAERRAQVVQTLSALGLPDYASAVVDALQDPAPLVAMTAARALARKEHPQYARAVLAQLPRFSDWRPGFLASMLATIGPEIVVPLRDCLADRSQPAAVRAVAAEALRRLYDLPAADLAIKVLAEEQDTELLAAALRLLSESARAEHLSAVRKMVSSRDPIVRANATRALARICAPEDLPTLQSAFNDPSAWVAVHAARGLRRIGASQLLRDLGTSNHPRATLALQILAEGSR